MNIYVKNPRLDDVLCSWTCCHNQLFPVFSKQKRNWIVKSIHLQTSIKYKQKVRIKHRGQIKHS